MFHFHKCKEKIPCTRYFSIVSSDAETMQLGGDQYIPLDETVVRVKGVLMAAQGLEKKSLASQSSPLLQIIYQ